jgi:hypothetical protein
MLILFDQSTALPIRRYLVGHTVKTAREQGWDRLANGALLRAADTGGFDVLLTADHGFAHQQNLKSFRIAVVIISRGQWPAIKPVVARVVTAVEAARAGTVTMVEI